MEERNEARDEYDRSLRKIKQAFCDTCNADSEGYAEDLTALNKASRKKIFKVLYMVQTELENNRTETDNELRSEEVIVSAMVHEQIEMAWACGKVDRTKRNIDKGAWVASKYDAVTAVLQLAGKDKVPHNVDTLLARRKPLIDLLYSALGTDLLSSHIPLVNMDLQDEEERG